MHRMQGRGSAAFPEALGSPRARSTKTTSKEAVLAPQAGFSWTGLRLTKATTQGYPNLRQDRTNPRTIGTAPICLRTLALSLYARTTQGTRSSLSFYSLLTWPRTTHCKQLPTISRDFGGGYSAGWNSTAEHRLANQQAIGLEHNAFSVNAVPENQNLQMLSLQLESVSDTNNSSANASSAFASAATIDSVASALAAIDGDDHLMSVYAAVHHRLDNAVGDFVAGLKALGKFESTLILFLSDNGGSSEGGMHGERTGDDPTLPESKWRLGQGWATVANAPFKGHKASVYEGGIATPFIAHWPEGIKRRGGSWEHAPAHVIDILPTLLDIVSGKGTMLYLTDILFTRGP